MTASAAWPKKIKRYKKKLFIELTHLRGDGLNSWNLEPGLAVELKAPDHYVFRQVTQAGYNRENLRNPAGRGISQLSKTQDCKVVEV